MESSAILRVIDIVEGTSVDGPGLRTSIYFAGCLHKCPGCHNIQTWSFEAGREMTIDELLDIVKENDFNVTFTGGDPLYQAEALTKLAKAIRNLGKNIWCYTGFVYEEIKDNQMIRPLLAQIDTLVDGPFIESLKDTSLLFRGSSNQRIINLR